MKQRLTIERLKELLTYNPETGVFVWNKNGKGRYMRAGAVAGSKHCAGYVQIHHGGNSYLAHRLAWFWVHGEWPSEIDHANGDRTDNRLENLRLCSRVENTWNMKTPKTNKSGFKGVSFFKPRKKWRATIKIDGKAKTLGYFNDPALAHQAYVDAITKHRGEFARAA
jgi:hypothetical protein